MLAYLTVSINLVKCFETLQDFLRKTKISFILTSKYTVFELTLNNYHIDLKFSTILKSKQVRNIMIFFKLPYPRQRYYR